MYVTTEKERLTHERETILRRRANREREFEQTRERIRAQYKRFPPVYAATEIKNAFSGSAYKIAQIEAEENRRLEYLDGEIAALDRLEAR